MVHVVSEMSLNCSCRNLTPLLDAFLSIFFLGLEQLTSEELIVHEQSTMIAHLQFAVSPVLQVVLNVLENFTTLDDLKLLLLLILELTLVLAHRSQTSVRIFVEQISKFHDSRLNSLSFVFLLPHSHKIVEVLTLELLVLVVKQVGNLAQVSVARVDP